MRIRDQLLLAMASAIAVAVIVLGSLAYVTERSAGNLLSQSDGQEIARDVANLLTLTQEYTVYGGARATGQWRAWHAQLRQTVERALARESEPHSALVEMRQRVLDLLPLYEGLEGAYRDASADLGPRRRELMVERLVSEMQELVDARHRWATAIIEQQAREQRAANVIVLASAVVLLVMVTGLVLLVRRRGLVPLERLRAAAAAIQQGDLSVRCDASARDELGDTGRAVNAMAESLLKVNAALRESQERYQLAVAGSDDGVFDWDYRSGLAFGSVRGRELLGLPPGPEMQTTAEWFAEVEAHLHPDDVLRRRAAIEAHMAGRTPTYEGEFRVRNPDGSYRWIRVRGLCIGDPGGAPHRMAGSISDIDARNRAEESLRRSEERFALAVAGTDDGILDWDIDNDRMFTSERAMEIVGLPPGPTTRSRSEWIALLKVHPDDRGRHDEAIRSNLAGETPVRDEEHRLLQDDGTYRWVRVRGTCVRDATGRAIRWVGSVSDIDARKRAEEALRLSEERYAIAMTGSDEAHWVWDVKTDELFASPQLRQLTGVADAGATPVTRTEWMASLPMFAADRHAVQKAVDDHLAGLTPRMEVEYRLLDPAGGPPRWLHTRGQCFRDADGVPERVAGATVDITQRKRAEESLRESEERFALAVAGSNDGILDWDVVNDRMYASGRVLAIVGLAPGTVVRTQGDWSAVVMPRFHPEDAVRLGRELNRESMRDTHDGEYRVRDAAGTYRWLRFRGRTLRDADGQPVRWSGSVSDIDAQKRTEQALRQSEARYQLAAEGANQGLWDWDLETDILFASPRFQELMGLAASDLLRPRRDWIARVTFHPDDVDAARAAMAAHLRGETRYFEAEFRMKHQSGEWHWYRQRGAALRDEAGRPYRVAGSMEDTTEQKNAEAERLRLESQLLQAKKLEAIGTLAGGIAHDFNNILAAILGNGEMAQSEAPAGSPLRRHVDAVVSAGTRAKSLVERILAFSRAGIGERVPVHVQSVVEEALGLVATSLPAHVRLERHLAGGDACVLGDPTQIHQVVMNLCTNGVQAIKVQGTLSVSLDVAERSAAIAATSAMSSGRYVRLRVADTGMGIAANALERIFDPFFTTKGVGVGTGLGLSLVHGIVTDLGGGIDVESKVGLGTTFTVYLPLSGSHVVPADGESFVANGDGETILLVDDEEPLVRLGEEMLARLGYEPVGFTSSAAALEAFRAAPDRFQAVLSDQAMPDVDGIELAREIRAIRPAVPIVLMSGFVSAALLTHAQGLGIAEVIAKPLVGRDIARCLADALGRVSVVQPRAM